MANHDFFDSELFQELVSDLHEEARFTATYRVEAEDFTEAKERAKEIAYEQTVECPQELIAGTWIESRVIGHVEDIKKAAPGVWYVYISYLPEAVESDFTELLNMLFGNISLLPGIRLMSFDLPEAFLSTFNGPKLGQGGIRELCGVESGPILMSAVKPLGRSSEELAAMVSALALGGCPIIKDDHSLFDQKWAPFEERVRLCADACAEANEKTGGSSIFVANCTGDGLAFLDRAYKAQELGAGGIMAAPGLLGFSLIKQLADAPDFQLPIFLHPCFTGSITMHEDSGIPPRRGGRGHLHQLRRPLHPLRAGLRPHRGEPQSSHGPAPVSLPRAERRHETPALPPHAPRLRRRHHLPRGRRAPDRRPGSHGKYENFPPEPPGSVMNHNTKESSKKGALFFLFFIQNPQRTPAFHCQGVSMSPPKVRTTSA